MRTTSIILIMCMPLLGSAQAQLALDTSSTQNAIVYTGTVTSNGDRVMAMRSTTGMMLWRATPNGSPVWARQLNSFGNMDAPLQIAADGQDGVVLMRHLSTLQMGSGAEPGLIDSLRLRYLVAHVSANGELSWQRVVSVTYKDTLPTMYFGAQALLGCGNGSVFLAIKNAGSLHGELSMLKLDMQGQTTWARSFRSYQGPDYWEAAKVVIDPNGGLFVSGSTPGAHTVHFAHAGADGTLNWVKRWNYTNAVVSGSEGAEAVALPDGSALAFRRINIPGHDYLSTIRVDQSGTLADAHFYTHPPMPWFLRYSCGLRADGSILLGADSLVMAVADDGSVNAAVAMTGHVDGDQRNRFIPLAMDAGPEGAVFAGVLNKVHVDLGYTHYWPAVRTIDPAMPGCYTVPVQINGVVVPPELYQVEDFTGYQEWPLNLVVGDSVEVSVPRSPLATTDLCIVMISTGVEAVNASMPFELSSKVVRRGEPLLFANTKAAVVSVFDSSGRCLVQRHLVADGLSTVDWAPGIYLVRCSSPGQEAALTQRVLVTP